MVAFIHFPLIDSTMLAAKRLLAETPQCKDTFLYADQQHAGLGRRGHGWVSPVGNLYLSLILHADKLPYTALPLLSALAVHQVLALQLRDRDVLQLKWPNDILYANQKVGGVLIEQATAALWIIGIGLNTTVAPANTRVPAVALQPYLTSSLPFDRLAFMKQFYASLHTLIDQYHRQGIQQVIRLWQAHAWGIGKNICWQNQHSPQRHQGKMLGLGENGSLLVETPKGTCKPLYAHEVFHLSIMAEAA